MAIYNSQEELLNTDWQSKINEAVAAGNQVLAAQYEQARNDKIASKEYQDWGGQQTQTNNYVQNLPTNSGSYDAAYKAAQNNDWEGAARAVNQIAFDEGRDKYGTYNMANANAYLNELQKQFGYNARDYYNQQYDKAYGEGSAAAYDATGGAIKSYAELVEKLGGADKAQQMLAQYTTGGNGVNGGVNDMTKYLEDLYASNLEAELSALKNAYDANVAELESQNDKIAEQYRAARNQAAAQNALEVQGMNERALATGLNTGASGQLALAQNMAYQGNLGNLWAKEAQDKAETDRLMAQLLNDYNANVNQTTANINAQRAEALYNEMIRQENARKAAVKNEQNALMTKAEMLAAFGDFSGYKALGYTDDEIAMMTNAYNASVLGNQSTGTKSTTPSASATYNNGYLTTEQVKQMQADINKYLPKDQQIAVDGKWGTATTNAAGGLTADEYAAIYYKQNSWSNRSDR